MSKKPESLTKGDWIVHAYYGLGQITKVETKVIGEDKAKYFRVDARNSTFFVPVKNVDPDRIRPLSSAYKFRKAKKILRSDPENLPENHNDRRKYISEFVTNNEMAPRLAFHMTPLVGSGVIIPTPSVANIPESDRYVDPSFPPVSSSGTIASLIVPFNSMSHALIALIAYIIAARPLFISDDPRPWRLPSRMLGSNCSRLSLGTTS